MYTSDSSPTLTDCIFSGNTGGGTWCSDCSPSLTDCLFARNGGSVLGIGLWCLNASPVIENCTFYGNEALPGCGTIYCHMDSHLSIKRTIVAFNTGASVIFSGSGGADFSCCDMYGNTGGDWVGGIAGWQGIEGNFWACPLFCESADDYRLQSCSPCVPGNHPDGYDCGLIGAFNVGCECGLPSMVARRSWGAVKGMYR